MTLRGGPLQRPSCATLADAALRASIGIAMVSAGSALLFRAGLAITAPALPATGAALARVIARRLAMRTNVRVARVVSPAQAAPVPNARHTIERPARAGRPDPPTAARAP